MHERLSSLISVNEKAYAKCFSSLTHTTLFPAPPSSTLRLHYVRPDASGEPDFRRLAHVLATYITHYCFTAQRRNELDEAEQNALFIEARKLFRDYENSGQAGELLIYFLLETVLSAPQVLKKMLITTNAKEERKGSDGVHLRWDKESGVLDVIFAESKLHASFSKGLSDAFDSIEKFHASETRDLEIKAFTANFPLLSPDMQEQVVAYVSGEHSDHRRFSQACLIGFNWAEYACLDDHRRGQFIAEFDLRYRTWLAGATPKLQSALTNIPHKSLHFEIFLLPFKSVSDFREWFNEELTGRAQ